MGKETQKTADPKIKKPIIKKFKGILEDAGLAVDAAFISFPYDVQQIFGTRGQVKVKVTFDGYPYRGILSVMGRGKHAILVRKDVRQAIAKNIGDVVNVVVEQDLEERVVDLPKELQDLLKKNPKAKAFFDTLSFTNRKEYALWIASAKKEETLVKRLEAALSKLMAGKKNPSEK
ncbi:MAG: DUF1905 domain-containing protein [Bacteroidetes bacterium]|nr:DUF1905 domain-containing protein [Bacteroidota bacterium]